MEALSTRDQICHPTAPEPPHTRLMACLSGDAFEPRLITECARLAARLHTPWYALYLADTAVPRLAHHARHSTGLLAQNVRLAAGLGAIIVRLRPDTAEQTLPAFARREGITHVMMGEHSESRWAALWAVSMLHEQVSRMAVLVIPGVDTPEVLPDGHITIEPHHAGSDRVPAAPSRPRLAGWGLAVTAVLLLFLFRAPAIVCLAGAAALAVFWCWELDADVRTPASETR
jgi:K+-sensing histidine kinase KdpD